MEISSRIISVTVQAKGLIIKRCDQHIKVIFMLLNVIR